MGKTRKNKMSDYNLQIAWSGKDALGDTDPDKVVSGGDFNTEFLAVKTAVNSKANLAGSASQAFAATTASSSTNTTQVATTQYVTTAVAANSITAAVVNNLVYPVGSIYTNMAVATNPATLLGMGTWVAYAEGRVLVGKAGSGTFDTLNENIGSETHALSIAELPAHGHPYRLSPASTAGSGATGGFMTSSSDSTVGPNNGGTGSGSGSQIGAAGSGSAHTNLQPSVTVYMWKRTA